MQKPPSRFAKIFGIGPMGLFVSLLLFALTLLLSRRFDTLKISDNRPLLTVIFVITSLISAGLIVFYSLFISRLSGVCGTFLLNSHRLHDKTLRWRTGLRGCSLFPDSLSGSEGLQRRRKKGVSLVGFSTNRGIHLTFLDIATNAFKFLYKSGYFLEDALFHC